MSDGDWMHGRLGDETRRDRGLQPRAICIFFSKRTSSDRARTGGGSVRLTRASVLRLHVARLCGGRGRAIVSRSADRGGYGCHTSAVSCIDQRGPRVRMTHRWEEKHNEREVIEESGGIARGAGATGQPPACRWGQAPSIPSMCHERPMSVVVRVAVTLRRY